MKSDKKRFYPTSAQVPQGLSTPEFYLRPLVVDDVEQDYEAVMSSREMLRLWAGGTWPADDFDVSGNYRDLERHQEEHFAREAFTYTVVSPGGETCIGCVYLEPIERRLRQGDPFPDLLDGIGDCEVLVRFWVRTSSLAANLDDRLFDALSRWLEQGWQFRRVYFRANARDKRQVRLFERAGLNLRAEFDVPGFAGPFRIYSQ